MERHLVICGIKRSGDNQFELFFPATEEESSDE